MAAWIEYDPGEWLNGDLIWKLVPNINRKQNYASIWAYCSDGDGTPLLRLYSPEQAPMVMSHLLDMIGTNARITRADLKTLVDAARVTIGEVAQDDDPQ